MRNCLGSLTESQLNTICAHYMNRVANKYLRSGDIKNYWRIQKEFNNGLKSIPLTIRQGVIWLKNKIIGGNFT